MHILIHPDQLVGIQAPLIATRVKLSGLLLIRSYLEYKPPSP